MKSKMFRTRIEDLHNEVLTSVEAILPKDCLDTDGVSLLHIKGSLKGVDCGGGLRWMVGYHSDCLPDSIYDLDVEQLISILSFLEKRQGTYLIK